jgi:phage major head subunit gpT-like protein
VAVVNAATLEALWISFHTQFMQTLERTKVRTADIASAVPSNTRIEHYPMVALTGRMKEWIDNRTIQDLAAFAASVQNVTYEHTVGVKREDIEDDTTGAYSLAIQQQAALGVLEPWLQIEDELGTNAFSTSLGYDGLAFFSTAHLWKGAYETVQSNTTTMGLSRTQVYAGIRQMSTFKGPDGLPLMVEPTHFLYAPALESQVDLLFNVQFAFDPSTNQQVSNTLFGKFPRENQIKMKTWSGYQWVMLDCSKPMKPVVAQTRRPLALTPMVKLDDPNVFYHKRFDFGMDYRGAVKALAWWLAYGADPSSISETSTGA